MAPAKAIQWAIGLLGAATLATPGAGRAGEPEVPAPWPAGLDHSLSPGTPPGEHPPEPPMPEAIPGPAPSLWAAAGPASRRDPREPSQPLLAAEATPPTATQPDSPALQGDPPPPAVIPTQADDGSGGPGAGPKPPLELDINADQQGFDLVINRFVATGKATASLAGGRLMADRLEYDTATRTLYASGSVRFQRGNQYLQASRMRYSLIEQSGELEDVYGVLDLKTSLQDLDLEQPPAQSLPPPQPLACPTELPDIPEWHPHPWATTLWGGQMFHSDFGQTFTGQGVLRPEYVLGAGIQRRLFKAGPFALELDFNALGHWASPQSGTRYTGPFSREEVGGFSTDGQFFGEFTGGILLRAWLQPWLSLGFIQGVSLNTSLSNYEDTYREKAARFLNYLGFEIEGSLSPQWALVGRIHHRSGAFGTYSGVREGSNAYLLGLRYRFGQDAPPRRDPQAAMPAPLGCPNRGAEPPDRPRSLPEALEQVAMGGGPPPEPSPAAAAGAGSVPQGSVRPSFRAMREQERRRAEASARIEQRISNVEQREGLVLERRRGGVGNGDTLTDQENDFGPARPPQVRRLASEKTPQAVEGTLTHLRYQAPRIVLTPEGWRADRASFTNDPFTPAQTWMDADNVRVSQDPNGDLLISSDRNRLLVEDRLPIPVQSRTRIRKQQEVENRWVLGNDRDDRDGLYVGRRLRPIRIGEKGTLQLEPQFLLERAFQGTTDSYPAPDGQAGGDTITQDTKLGDLFGLEARLRTPLLGFEASLNLDMSTFNPDNIPNGTRSWGELERNVRLPLIGDAKARIFGAYRFRVWNGSLGEQDVYSAYGASLEKEGTLPNWGPLSNSYVWRVGFGNFQSNEFIANEGDSTNFAQLWRGSAGASLNSSLTLWRGQPLPATPDAGLRYSPEPIVPGLTISTNLQASLAYFGDGSSQNVLAFSGGPTLTLGHFSRPFLDFTQLTLTGGIAVREGSSPFAFDQAIDLGTVGIGLTQQLAGPLLFNGGIGLNVDPRSENYGEVTGSFVELRWQRRSYAFSIFYSPYEGIGGVRLRLNDFGFNGTGVPFVPFRPGTAGVPANALF